MSVRDGQAAQLEPGIIFLRDFNKTAAVRQTIHADYEAASLSVELMAGC